MSDLTLKLTREQITLMSELGAWAGTELRGTGFAYPLEADYIASVAASIKGKDGEEFTMELSMFGYRAVNYWRQTYKNRTEDTPENTRFDAIGELMNHRVS